MAIDYTTKFSTMLDKKYAAESKTYDLTLSNKGVSFVNANTLKIPMLTVGGYKYHTRGNTYNKANISNTFQTKVLSHDRDAEFIIDAMDVEETSAIVSIANIQNTFEEQQAIPEWDAYRLSKLYQDMCDFDKDAGEVAANSAAVLAWFDAVSVKMDDAGVPLEGRILYCTPAYKKLLEQSLTRQLSAKDKAFENTIERISETKLIGVPSARMYTAYDFTTGFTPEDGADEMAMILVHPSAVVARTKYAYMKAFQPGSDSRTADAWIYQIRQYGDLFLLKNKVAGVEIALKASN